MYSEARQDLQDLVQHNHPTEKLRYSTLLLSLHTLFGIHCGMLQTLFCKHLTDNGGIGAFINDALNAAAAASAEESTPSNWWRCSRGIFIISFFFFFFFIPVKTVRLRRPLLYRGAVCYKCLCVWKVRALSLSLSHPFCSAVSLPWVVLVPAKWWTESEERWCFGGNSEIQLSGNGWSVGGGWPNWVFWSLWANTSWTVWLTGVLHSLMTQVGDPGWFSWRPCRETMFSLVCIEVMHDRLSASYCCVLLRLHFFLLCFCHENKDIDSTETLMLLVLFWRPLAARFDSRVMGYSTLSFPQWAFSRVFPWKPQGWIQWEEEATGNIIDFCLTNHL